MEKAAEMIAAFHGAERRFEIVGEPAGITLISDYAHHPTEIRTTLAAARSRYPDRRIWAVWQPHTYSRTRSLASDFASAFSDADRVIVTEIYASREAHQDFSSAEIVKNMDSAKTIFIPELVQVTAYLSKELKTGDIVLVLSAGDADQILCNLGSLERNVQ
jgi:UDP-N-acetylmuramate--alanine ligase